ncbi:MAG: toll/interleukin-1 receptor domain-containing protein [Lysobacteraceae bacterium]
MLITPNARGPFELTEQGCAAIAAEQSLRRPGGRAALLLCCGDVNLLSPTYSLQSRLCTTASRSATLLREHQPESCCVFVSRRKAIMMTIRRRKPGVPPRSFISHSSKDKPIARRLLRRLRMLGSDAYLDENDLRIGDQISSALKRNIRTSDFFLVVWTENARQSAWVGKEIKYALQSRIPIVPLLFIDPAGHIGIEDSKGVDFRLGTGFEGNLLEIAARLGLMQQYQQGGFENEIAELSSRYDWARRFLDLQEPFHLIQAPGKPNFAALDYLPKADSIELFELDALCFSIAKTAPPVNLISVYSAVFGYLTAKHGVAFEAAGCVVHDCNARRDTRPNVIDLSTSHKVFDLLIDLPFGEVAHIERAVELAEMDPRRASGWARHIANSTTDGAIPTKVATRLLSLAGADARDGWPVDLLIAWGAHKDVAQAASAKLISFMHAGHFDGYRDHRITECPSLYLLAVQRFAESGQDDIASTMAEKAVRRIRDGILNPPSSTDANPSGVEQFCISLWWIHNAIKMAPTRTGSGLAWATKLEEALWDSDQYETIYYFWNEPLKSMLRELHDLVRARVRSGLILGKHGSVGLDTTELNDRLGQLFKGFGFERNLR